MTVSGSRGSSHKLTAIPASHFKHHELFDSFFTENVLTHDPQRAIDDQDTEKCYLNLYAPLTLLIFLRRKRPWNQS